MKRPRATSSLHDPVIGVGSVIVTVKKEIKQHRADGYQSLLAGSGRVGQKQRMYFVPATGLDCTEGLHCIAGSVTHWVCELVHLNKTYIQFNAIVNNFPQFSSEHQTASNKNQTICNNKQTTSNKRQTTRNKQQASWFPR